MRSPQLLIFCVLASLGLTGCTASKDFSDIEEFMDEVESRPRGRIEPLPPIETIPPFSYMASAKRSPFEPPIVVKRVDRQDGPQVTPDFNRVKQYLEQYQIGQLSMVGTLSQRGSRFALIQDADGGVHRVQIGDFVGTDHGKIELISDTSIELIEIVPDGIGGWVQRSRTVALANAA